jgi:hypothetical protein
MELFYLAGQNLNFYMDPFITPREAVSNMCQLMHQVQTSIKNKMDRFDGLSHLFNTTKIMGKILLPVCLNVCMCVYADVFFACMLTFGNMLINR